MNLIREISVNLTPPTAKGSTINVSILALEIESGQIEHFSIATNSTSPENCFVDAMNEVLYKDSFKGYSIKIRPKNEIPIYRILAMWIE